MKKSKDELLKRIQQKAEEFASFANSSISSEKSKCHHQLSKSTTEYFTSSPVESRKRKYISSDDDNDSEVDGDCDGGDGGGALNNNMVKEDFSGFVKLFTRDFHWFSMSSYKKGLTKIIGNLLIKVAANTLSTKSSHALSMIFIKISCMVFQWNNTSESLSHATMFLNFLKELLNIHSTNAVSSESDRLFIQDMHSTLLSEMKLSKKSPANVIETRVFMVFSTLKTILLSRPKYPITDTLVSLVSLSTQFSRLPITGGDGTPTVSQHISFRVQKIFADDNERGGGRLSRAARQNGLDISTDYHASDHYTTSSSVMANVLDHDTTKNMNKSLKVSGGPIEIWLQRDLRNWVTIRRHPFISSLAAVVSHLIKVWASDSYDVARVLFKNLHGSLPCLIHTLIFSLKQSDTKDKIIRIQRNSFMVHASVDVILLSCMQSPVMYLNQILTTIHKSISKYFNYIFDSTPTTIGSNIEKGNASSIDVTIECPWQAVNGLKLCCHILASIVSHVSCVSSKDLVCSTMFIVNLLETSLSKMKFIHLPTEQRVYARSCVCILSSYLSYIISHCYSIFHEEIFILKNIGLRNALMAIYDDSICDNVEVKVESESDAVEKCIDFTHPFLASYLCAVIMPRLGIHCTLQYSAPLEANEGNDDTWYNQRYQSQSSAFCNTDLFTIDLTQLISWLGNRRESSNIESNIAEQLDDLFPLKQWITSDLPNIHPCLVSESVVRDSTKSFLLQSLAFNVDAVDVSEDEEEVEELRVDDHKRCVDVADRAFSYDICVVVMEYVSYKRVCRLACVNKQFSLAAACSVVWERLYKKRFSFLLDITPPVLTKKQRDAAAKNDNESGNNAAEPTCTYCNQSDDKTPDESKLPLVKKASHCNGIAKRHDWRALFKTKMLLLKSIKDKEKSKKGNFINLSNLPKICQILGCDFTYRTDKQKETHFSKKHKQVTKPVDF